MEYKTISDTIKNRCNWNHLRIIQIFPKKHTGKARNQATTNKQPYSPQYTYFGQYCCKSVLQSKWEITLQAAQIVNVQESQDYTR
jgi:hypothetical protein